MFWWLYLQWAKLIKLNTNHYFLYLKNRAIFSYFVPKQSCSLPNFFLTSFTQAGRRRAYMYSKQGLMAGEFKCNLMGFASSSTESAKYENVQIFVFFWTFVIDTPAKPGSSSSVYLRPVSGDWFMFVHKFIERDNKENQFSKSESIRDGWEGYVISRAGLWRGGDLFPDVLFRTSSTDGSPAHNHAHWAGPKNYEKAQPHEQVRYLCGGINSVFIKPTP